MKNVCFAVLMVCCFSNNSSQVMGAEVLWAADPRARRVQPKVDLGRTVVARGEKNLRFVPKMAREDQILRDCLQAGLFEDYYSFVKSRKIELVTGFLDTLLPDGDDAFFLSEKFDCSRLHHGPRNRTLGEFKRALSTTILSIDLESVIAPLSDGKVDGFKSAISARLSGAVSEFVRKLGDGDIVERSANYSQLLTGYSGADFVRALNFFVK